MGGGACVWGQRLLPLRYWAQVRSSSWVLEYWILALDTAMDRWLCGFWLHLSATGSCLHLPYVILYLVYVRVIS